MQRLNLLEDGVCFVEFGAGKGRDDSSTCLDISILLRFSLNFIPVSGGLSHWVQKSVDTKPNTQFVLIDRSSVRYRVRFRCSLFEKTNHW